MMRAMIIRIPMQTAAAGVRRVAVSLPYIDFLSPTGRTSIHGRKIYRRRTRSIPSQSAGSDGAVGGAGDRPGMACLSGRASRWGNGPGRLLV